MPLERPKKKYLLLITNENTIFVYIISEPRKISEKAAGYLEGRILQNIQERSQILLGRIPAKKNFQGDVLK